MIDDSANIVSMKEQGDETASEECVHLSGADDVVRSSRGPGLLPAAATGTPDTICIGVLDCTLYRMRGTR